MKWHTLVLRGAALAAVAIVPPLVRRGKLPPEAEAVAAVVRELLAPKP